LANKLFEYLSAGLPVVSSLAGENETLIREHDCGLTYRAGDGADCHRQLLQLLDNAGRRREMGARGKQLFLAQFDADSVFARLVTHLEGVGGATPANACGAVGFSPQA
jgi:glycosyltransferase involved in cell wall biosynthesis